MVKIASNADGNSLFKACENVDGVGEIFAKKLLMVSKENQIKGNKGNCHLILSTGDWSEIQIANSLIKCSCCKKLVVKFDHKLTFDYHVKNVKTQM